ncbi:type III pantothenate kinase [Nitrosophilus labii]|uniref:type III pantothenate kinase n=1 Tax=Nitrosophilus labii TaxID=2706014 RepID=UPI001656FE33|nr:type III pantothenate kinase [Nitrosophilus labii]
MLLCDIGNSFAHFCDGKRVWREEPDSFLEKYLDKKVYFINVNEDFKKSLIKAKNWIDLEKYTDFDTNYKGMGIDRKVLCIAVEDGVAVDAGSAITVDLMEKGVHKGGFIIPGFKRIEESYSLISKRLRFKLDFDIDLNNIPQNTKSAISYGAVKPVVLAIQDFAKNKKIYLTGGDGEKILPFLNNAEYDEKLIFKGMKKIIKEKLC